MSHRSLLDGPSPLMAIVILALLLSPLLVDAADDDLRLFPSFEKPQHLLVLDLNGVDAALHPALAALEGVVNRREPRIYLIWTWHGRAWLEDTIVPRGVGFEEIGDPLELFRRFRDEISGCIVYDPTLPGTINVATTMAGVLNATVVDPKYVETLEAMGIPAIADLRGRWGKGEIAEMYDWAFQTYWQDCTHRILAHLDPAKHHLRDYLVACRVFTFFCDIGMPDERRLMESILSHEDVGINTPVLGYFPQVEAFNLATETGCFLVTTNFAPSLTVHSAMEAELPLLQERRSPPTLEDSVYVTFVVCDGSSINCNLDYLRFQWDDPARGEVPIGWTVNPLLAELAPAIAEWYYQAATDGDYLMAGPSGIGNMYPSSYPDLSAYTRIGARYLDLMDLKEMCLWNFPHQGDHAAARQIIEEFNLTAVIENTHESLLRLSDGMYMGTLMQVVCDPTESQQDKANEIIDSVHERVPEDQRPCFVCVSLASCDVTPSLLKEVAASLGSEFMVIRPDEFFALLADMDAMEILWERWHETIDVGRCRIARAGDGSFILAYDTHLEEEGRRAHLIKVDDEGRAVWESSYEYGSIFCLSGTPDGGGLAACEGAEGHRIFRVDGDGKVVWDRGLNLSWGPYMMVVTTAPDRILLAGEDHLLDRIHLMLMDGRGDVIWERSHQLPWQWVREGINIWGIAESDGDFFVLADTWGIWPRMPNLLKVDGSGKKIWHKRLFVASVSSITSSGDGGVVITGQELDPLILLFVVGRERPWVLLLSFGLLSLLLALFWKSYLLVVGRWEPRRRRWIVRLSAVVFVLLSVVVLLEGFPHFHAEDGGLHLFKIDGVGRRVWKRSNHEHLGPARAESVIPTDDGGFVVVGTIASRSYRGYEEIYLLRTDSGGHRIWESVYGAEKAYETIGGDPMEWIRSVAPASGWGLVGVQSYEDDVYCVRIDGTGQRQWERVFGDMVLLTDAVEAGDGGYLVTGTTHATGSGPSDAYLLRVDADGKDVWERTYGGAGWDFAVSMVGTGDGFVVAGSTASFGRGDEEVFIFKTDLHGETIWNTTYGGPGRDSAVKVLNCDGGCLVAGDLMCGPHGGNTFLLRMDDLGRVLWERTYSEEQRDRLKSVAPSGDGGFFLLAGRETPYDGRTYSGVRCGLVLLRVDERGELVWEKQLEEGDYGSEGWTNCLIDSGDGGVVLGGMREIWRQNPPVLFLTKFDAEGNIIWDRSYDEGHNIPKDIIRTDDGGFIMAGEHGVYLLRVSGDGERIMLQRRQDGMGDFVAGGCDSEYLLGGYSKGGADRWFLMKFKEHLSNP